jgi:hypothetical protein
MRNDHSQSVSQSAAQPKNLIKIVDRTSKNGDPDQKQTPAGQLVSEHSVEFGHHRNQAITTPRYLK